MATREPRQNTKLEGPNRGVYSTTTNPVGLIGGRVKSTCYMNMEYCSALQSSMPGSFTFESSPTPKLDVSAGAKTHFFLPPSSASSSLYSSHATLSTLSTHDDRSTTKRKRCQADERALDAIGYGPSVASLLSTQDSVDSPAPLANERYRLAGGLDTPTSKMSLSHDDFNPVSADGRFGTAGGHQLSQPFGIRGQEGYFEQHLGASALSRERNGQARIAPPPNIRDGLGRTLHQVVGVAGKVLEFCRNTAFRGFLAGGGVGYELERGTTQGSEMGDLNRWHPVEEKDLAFWRETDGESTPVPGRFPEEDFIPDYMSQDHTSPISTRAAKRIQREKGAALEISENWMLVGDKGAFSASREASPSRLSARKVPFAASTASTGRRTAPRPGRRPILPASHTSLTSFAGSPSLRSHRSASYASPRSPAGSQRSPKREPGSPVSVEVQRHAARIRKRELEEDKNLSRFNQQLKAMIKEGKEALGSRVEVEDEIG